MPVFVDFWKFGIERTPRQQTMFDVSSEYLIHQAGE